MIRQAYYRPATAFDKCPTLALTHFLEKFYILHNVSYILESKSVLTELLSKTNC